MVSPRAAVVPLREEPREGAEQATQLLFGEPCTLLDTQERWVRVRSEWDGQEGWADRKMMQLTGESPRVPAKLTMGSMVDGQRVLTGDIRLTEPLPFTHDNLLRIYSILFSLFGVQLLRNASEQITQGTPVPSLPEAQAGDHVFFDHADQDPAKTNISHVGILLSEDEVWHCSGWVRRDVIDAQGIRTADGSYTHHLAGIRRMMR